MGCTTQDRPVHNLGVLLDLQLLLNKQVAVVARKAFAKLCVVFQLCSFLNQEFLNSVTQAPVISCLDYCNVLLCGDTVKMYLEASADAEQFCCITIL